MTNFTRTCYRVTGGKISDNAIVMGSSSAAAAETLLGTVEVAHGMRNVPAIAFASPFASQSSRCFRKVCLYGMGATYLTFITASAGPMASDETTLVGSAYSSGVTMTFTWMALG